MNKKISKRNKQIIISLVILSVVVLAVIYFVFLRNDKAITFNQKYLSIEYGETLDYEKAIESVNPKDAKIIYPKIEVKEVGIYHLTFTYKIDGKEKTQEQDFEVKDTKLPTLKIKNEKTVEVLVNTEYDVFRNIKEYVNVSEDAQQNRQLVSSDDYKKIKKQIEEKNNEILNREITTKDDIKESDIFKNGILYTTDFDVTKEGSYNIKMLVVDENYNTDEIKWKLKVVAAGQLVNSGGIVSCVYPNEDLQTNDAYTTDYSEVYNYDENKLVSSLTFMTKMTFKEDYDTDENVSALVNAINSKYAEYMNHEGITVNIEPSATTVVTNIIVDFNVYDLKNDPLNLLESKNTGKVKIENVVNKVKDKATCELH